MKNGTIFIMHRRKSTVWYVNLISWLITKMSVAGPFTHVQGYLDGWLYEYTFIGDKVHHARKTEGISHATNNKDAGDLVREPIRDLTDEEVHMMVEWWEYQIEQEYKYGTAKLIIQLVLGLLLRPFAILIYRLFGWEIMASNKVWGEHCSASWDEDFKAAGIDLFPNHSEQYTTPAAFAYSDFFKTV